jgi:2,4-dienoyl-CoA reductase (NADPH2)
MPVNTKYRKLLEPAQIGSVKTRNRMIKTGASMCYWHQENTHMTEKALAFYEALARGGIGLLIVESPDLDYPYGARWKERYRIDDDKYIEGLKELTGVIHKHNCPTFVQMWHDGPWQNPLFPDKPSTYDGPPIGASTVHLDIISDFHRDAPRVLTISEIESLIDKWASAAIRAQKAGFDGIDINAGSSHLMHNFLSPFWNKGNDKYGGSAENRARFLTGIIKEVKKRAGKDFAVSVLINAIEVRQAIGISNDKCLTIEDAKKTAAILQDAGADSLQIRNQWLGYHVGGFFPDYLFYPEPPIPENEFPKEYNWHGRGAGANKYFVEGIRKVVSVPLIIVGKIDYDLGEKILREGAADFIGMTRALQCDPEYPNKIAEDRVEDIAPCTACATCLDQSISMERRCRINAAMGTTSYQVEKAEKKKKVVVVGGGPAGMEAARVAALRGHEVTLYEKNRLGGLLPVAAVVKGIELENLPKMVRYFKTQIKKLGIKTVLGKEFTASTLEESKPDVVVIAAGGTLTLPKIAGIDKRNVVNNISLHRMLKFYLKFFSPEMLGWLSKIWLPIGKSAVIIGSDIHGFEIAEFLIKRGRKITIVDTAEVPGKGMLDLRMGLVMEWFGRKGIQVINGLKSIEITDHGVEIVKADGTKQTIEADSVIPTSPLEANTSLYKELEGKIPELYAIGDCNNPNMIVDAIADGWKTGNII